ncbi:putative aldouronate transport system permease protein [Paenibacillus algorifonticola]|uniref:Putative aldouronate transport system permease protein n=1 Tax=Paenibacillus algorifonticola TaxID=684063 RepID=A0A1I1XY73_9BACL|nr:carbohydrate ABC transporter permease [Paenibacillus algorifonticola]SFE12316.1 putative aldouronate transport system permease protein [Paenibacillus algorifonticola]
MIQTRGERTFAHFSAIVMTLITLAAFLPFILIFVASFTDESALISNGYSYFPEKWSLDAYVYMYTTASTFVRAYGVSFFVTIVGTAVSTILTAMLAYPMARRDFKLHNVLAFIVFFTMLFSGGVVPTYMMWTKIFHIKDSLWALIVPSYLISGFNVLLVRNYYKNNVPVDLIESAQIDGASELKTFYRIMLPLSIPVLVTIGLFTALTYWNDWINALYYITKPQYYGVQNLLIQLMNNIQYLKSDQASSMIGVGAVELPSTAVRMAMAVIGILPILVVLPFLQKYLTKGVVIGAVKG